MGSCLDTDIDPMNLQVQFKVTSRLLGNGTPLS